MMTNESKRPTAEAILEEVERRAEYCRGIADKHGSQHNDSQATALEYLAYWIRTGERS